MLLLSQSRSTLFCLINLIAEVSAIDSRVTGDRRNICAWVRSVVVKWPLCALQVLLEPQEGLMGSVVCARITAASRWNVTGDIVSVVFQPPGAPPIRCAPDTPNGAAATPAGEVHPKQHSPPNSRPSPRHAPLDTSLESSSSDAAAVSSSTASGAEDSSSSSARQYFASGNNGGAARSQGDKVLNGSRGGLVSYNGSLLESGEAEPWPSCNGSGVDAVQSTECGCTADSCQQEAVTSNSSAGSMDEHCHSDWQSKESTPQSSADASSISERSCLSETQDATEHGSAGPPDSNISAGMACSAYVSPTGQTQHASSAGQMNSSTDATKHASRADIPATADASRAAFSGSIPPVAAVKKPEKKRISTSGKGGTKSFASSRASPDVQDAVMKQAGQSPPVPRRSSGAGEPSALPSKSKSAGGHNGVGSLTGSVQCNGSTAAGAWSSHAVDVLLCTGILLGLSGVLISGVLLLLSS